MIYSVKKDVVIKKHDSNEVLVEDHSESNKTFETINNAQLYAQENFDNQFAEAKKTADDVVIKEKKIFGEDSKSHILMLSIKNNFTMSVDYEIVRKEN